MSAQRNLVGFVPIADLDAWVPRTLESIVVNCKRVN